MLRLQTRLASAIPTKAAAPAESQSQPLQPVPSRFSLDALVNIAAALRQRVHVELEAV
jgi:hypothetical protein